jgi:hypothetical protein
VTGTRNLLAGPAPGPEAAPAAAHSRQLLCDRLLRPARRGAARRGRPARGGLPGAECASSGRPRRPGAVELGLRVVQVRTGVVLDSSAARWEDAAALPARRRRPRRRRAAVHAVDPRGRRRRDDPRRRSRTSAGAAGQRDGAEPVTNAEFSRALGRALHRPSMLPVPALALRSALRRDGRDRHDGRARGSRQAARAGIRVPPPRSRRGAELGGLGG